MRKAERVCVCMSERAKAEMLHFCCYYCIIKDRSIDCILFDFESQAVDETTYNNNS